METMTKEKPTLSTAWKIVIGVLLVLLAASFLNNTGNDTGIDTGQVATDSDSGLTNQQMEPVYVSLLRAWSLDKEMNIIDSSTDAELVDLGYIFCDTFAAGATWEDAGLEVLAGLESSGRLTQTNIEAAGYVMGAAVPAFCPEYEGRMP